MPLSVYTPLDLGRVPPASFGASFASTFGDKLLEGVQKYQAIKDIDNASKEAGSLFEDPAVGNIFRQMAMAAVRRGESPQPLIQQMLSSAIQIRRDKDQDAQQERMAGIQFGYSTRMENQRTANDLTKINDQQAFQEEMNSPERAAAVAKARAMGQIEAEDSPEARARDIKDFTAQENLFARRQAIETNENIRQAQALKELNLTDSDSAAAIGAAIADAGIDITRQVETMTPEQVDDELNTIATIVDPEVRYALNRRFRLLETQKRISLNPMQSGMQQKNRGSTPNVLPPRPSEKAQGRYAPITP